MGHDGVLTENWCPRPLLCRTIPTVRSPPHTQRLGSALFGKPSQPLTPVTTKARELRLADYLHTLALFFDRWQENIALWIPNRVM